jgi:3-oxoisoapionate decarboxylase
MSLVACSQTFPAGSPLHFSAAALSTPADTPRKTSLGLVTYAVLIQQKAASQIPGLPNFSDPLHFLTAARQAGASGIQTALGIRDADYIKKLRAFAEEHHLFLEATSVLPKTEQDLDRFEKEMVTAHACGVSIVRTVILPGRRYEQFKTYEEFKAAVEQGIKMLQRAEPIARRHHLRLAVENHKDQRTEERLKLLASFSSEHIGATLDVGNSLALLEDPVATAQAFAPWTLTVHFKDQGLAEYQDGFLLADVPVGQGCIDLPAILKILRQHAPKARLSLELITRDPLKVPVLTDTYWPTLGQVTAAELASLLQSSKHKQPRSFELISHLPLAAQVQAEQRNITSSLNFAATQLGLTA